LTERGRGADEIRRIGRQAGLDVVAICDAGPFHETRRVLHERAAHGWAAGMQFTYRNPERSTNPGATLPGAAAIVVGARRYERRLDQALIGTDATTRGPEGRVAMYAWVDHYRPLRAALGQVADHIRNEGWRARVLVDDNALVDRAAAVRAGIGWYGKNTNVLVPGMGSWFVLGSVVTDAPLTEAAPPPPPVADGCGPCERCLSACPTGALVGAGQLDARRCLAWLLQAPGVFPVEFRVALGDRLYGCDDCQTACPVNRIATRRHQPEEPEAHAQPWVDVLNLLQLGDGPLMALVGRWYIPGREPRYVRRNALIILGNIADPADPAVVAAVARALGDTDPIVRSHAVWAARRLGRPELLQALEADADPLVRAELARLVPARSELVPTRSEPVRVGPPPAGPGSPATAGPPPARSRP
jgi:epoxyqueuosine reductase